MPGRTSSRRAPGGPAEGAGARPEGRFRDLPHRGRLVAISISTVMLMAGHGVITPVLPLHARSFGVGTAAIGLTLSSYALARLVLNIPLGLLSDRYGRRLLLVGGPLVTAAGMFGSGFSGTFIHLLLWRLVAGAGSAMYQSGAQAYLADISTTATRARFMGTNHGALLLGTAIGPAIGGFLAETFGLRAPFVAVGVASVVAMTYSWLRLPETHTARPRPARPARPERGRSGRRAAARPRAAWLDFALSRDFVSVAFVTMAIFFTRAGSSYTILPILAVDTLGFSTSSLGLLFSAMALATMAGIAPASSLADRAGRKWAIVPSGLGSGLALVVMALAMSKIGLVVGAMSLAVATAIAGSAPAAYAADITPPALRGLGLGLFRTAGDVGLVSGPAILGLLADSAGARTALVVNAVLVVAAASVFAFMARETLSRTSLAVGALGAPLDAGH